MKNEITVQQTTTVYEYELIDNGVLLTDTECGLRVAALNDDDGRGITNQKVEKLLGDWLHGEIENVIERSTAEKLKITNNPPMCKNDKRLQLFEQIIRWHKENEEERMVFAIFVENDSFTSAIASDNTDKLVNVFLNMMETKEVAKVILKAALVYTTNQKRAKRDLDNADSK